VIGITNDGLATKQWKSQQGNSQWFHDLFGKETTSLVLVEELPLRELFLFVV
jgi:hypothetical protein